VDVVCASRLEVVAAFRGEKKHHQMQWSQSRLQRPSLSGEKLIAVGSRGAIAAAGDAFDVVAVIGPEAIGPAAAAPCLRAPDWRASIAPRSQSMGPVSCFLSRSQTAAKRVRC